MDRRLNAASGFTNLAVGTAVAFPEENGIVLDKWLMDVCGEEDLQFPSHRRVQYPAYIERLRRVSKTKQFIANTFDYPSRSGTREVLVLQKTLEALGIEEQLLRNEVNKMQESVTQVRRMLDERTMGASSLVEEERAQAAKLAEMRAEQQQQREKAAAAQQQQSQQQEVSPSSPAQAALAARRQGYTPLNAFTPVTVITASPRPTTSTATTSPCRTGGPLSMPAVDYDCDDLPTAGGSVTPPLNTNVAAFTPEQNTFSDVARAARRADYEKKKALSLRYLAEVQSKTQTAAGQRREVEERHAELLREKGTLDKEYEALHTTEALVVARHEEAKSHEHEETAQLRVETAAYAAEDAAFASVWNEIEAEADSASQMDAEVSPAIATQEKQKKENVEMPLATAAVSALTALSQKGASEEQSLTDETVTCCNSDNAGEHTLLHSLPLVGAEQENSNHRHDNNSNNTATASASLTPAENDKSPPEATFNTHRPSSGGSNSVASFTPPASHYQSPVERELQLSHGRDDDEDINDKSHDASEKEKWITHTPNYADVTVTPSSPSAGLVVVKSVIACGREARRMLLEELRHKLSELGAATQACRRQLLNTSQNHVGRFRQAQHRLKDWQDIAAQVRATYQQLRSQVEVINTALQDAAARLDKEDSCPSDMTYTMQLAKLNELLKERSYETFQYYMGNGEAAAMDMLYDANAEEELRALHRPSPSAAAGGMTPIRGMESATTSSTPTRESSVSGAYHTPGGARNTSNKSCTTPTGGVHSSSLPAGANCDAPHKHRSRYELVRHLQRWEATLLADRLAILKAANMVPGPFNGAGANTRKTEGLNATRCYQELRQLLIQAKPANGSTS